MTHGPQLPAGYRLISLEQVDSTNQLAKAEAARGAPSGTVVWARAQTAGRGRYGRGFVSLPGNLFVSLVLRPARAPHRVAQLGFVAGVALAEAVERAGPQSEVRLKWPNDVLVNGRKVAGILLETQSTGDGALDWVVLGVGVNVAAHPEGMPYPTTSLHAEGHPTTLTAADLLSRFLTRFDPLYRAWAEAGFGPIREAWLSRAFGLHAPINVRLPDATLTGLFRGLRDDGALMLAAEDGRTRAVGAGEVYFSAAD